MNCAVMVNYTFANEFKNLIQNISNCKVENVIEFESNKLLEYWISCDESDKDLVIEMAFMTFIKTFKYQKYYELPSKSGK
jgi:hypothetical protein